MNHFCCSQSYKFTWARTQTNCTWLVLMTLFAWQESLGRSSLPLRWGAPFFAPSPQKFCIKKDSELLPAAYGDKYRDPQLYNMQRVIDLGTLSLKWDLSIQSPTLCLRKLCRKGSIKSGRGWRTSRNQGLLDTTGLTHICTQWLWDYSQGLHWSDGVLELKGKVDTGPHTNPEAIAIW